MVGIYICYSIGYIFKEISEVRFFNFLVKKKVKFKDEKVKMWEFFSYVNDLFNDNNNIYSKEKKKDNDIKVY